MSRIQERHNLFKDCVRYVADLNLGLRGFLELHVVAGCDAATFKTRRVGTLLEHCLELLRKLRDHDFMSVERFAFDNEGNIGELRIIKHTEKTHMKTLGRS